MADALFSPSQLDSDQILKYSFDDQSQRLRVETAATLVAGAIEVAIDASTDNIQVRDPSTGYNLKINSDGSLNVVTSGGTTTVTGTVTTKEAGSDDFQTSQYIIGLSVVQLAPSPLSGRTSLSIRIDKNNTGAIYIGNSAAVTTSTGYPLFEGDTLGMDLSDSKSLYAISDTANQKLALLEIS